MHTVDIRKRAAEDVFRTMRPDAVIHMATVTHLLQQSEDRYRINLGGTRAVFEHCHAYGVKHAIFVGRHTYYGAAAGLAALPHRGRAPERRDARSRSSPISSPPISTRAPRSGASPSSTRPCCAFVTRSARRGTARSRRSSAPSAHPARARLRSALPVHARGRRGRGDRRRAREERCAASSTCGPAAGAALA